MRPLLSDRGGYPADDEAEDEILSEDDGEYWGPPRPQVNTHASGYEQDNGSKDLEFYPTPSDISLIRSLLPLPPELITQILDLAEY